MSEFPRKTIEELKTRYFCEPSLRDVYVEGDFDKDIINKWCKDHGEKNIIPYVIDSVDIPLYILDKYALTSGNKQRVIALAQELKDIGSDAYTCIIDRDLDHWLKDLDVVPRLIWTQYCSIELYYFTEDVIKDIIVNISKSKIKNWDEFYSSFILTLKKIYSLRLCDAQMNLNLKWIDLSKYIIFNNSAIFLDEKGYLRMTLINNGVTAREKEFNQRVNDWFDKMNCDPRLCIRGHDFVDMMARVNKAFKGVKGYTDPQTVERLFITMVDKIDELIQSIR
ncbi:DUF4435 domain-containing protein [Dickeya dadantii]|uniref:DUF4435 domain-containing protein n=1 Tax=Dickeya dadantii TaxID=204038 RepID=UPI001CC8034D|nr:DUF4435 domain-containing protein [Dickeya dadantii]UAY95117.1 DUF4435 domain-containing protein [Dickeya dadantii]